MRADSTMSIRDLAAQATPDDIQALLRALNDKTQQIDEMKRTSDAATLDHEEEMFRLQEQVDSTQKELTQKRKEEKELKLRLKQQDDHVISLEAQLQKQTARADSLRDTHAAAKKALEEQRSKYLTLIQIGANRSHDLVAGADEKVRSLHSPCRTQADRAVSYEKLYEPKKTTFEQQNKKSCKLRQS